MRNKFKSPIAFRRAMEACVKEEARQAESDPNRQRQLVIFERFLDRVYAAWGEAVMLKGGYALELRLERARTTKDVDMRLTGDLPQMLEKLTAAAAKQGEDFFAFEIRAAREHSEMIGDQVRYEGKRLDVIPLHGGKQYGNQFHIDISVGDKLVLPAEPIDGPSYFAFAGLPSVRHRIYPVEAHIAEKFHALTMPRPDGRPNSRLKDLIDVGLLAENTSFESHKLMASINATFEFRATHPVPDKFPAFPENWAERYLRLRTENELKWAAITELEMEARAFIESLLVLPDANHIWDPIKKVWVA